MKAEFKGDETPIVKNIENLTEEFLKDYLMKSVNKKSKRISDKASILKDFINSCDFGCSRTKKNIKRLISLHIEEDLENKSFIAGEVIIITKSKKKGQKPKVLRKKMDIDKYHFDIPLMCSTNVNYFITFFGDEIYINESYIKEIKTPTEKDIDFLIRSWMFFKSKNTENSFPIMVKSFFTKDWFSIIDDEEEFYRSEFI